MKQRRQTNTKHKNQSRVAPEGDKLLVLMSSVSLPPLPSSLHHEECEAGSADEHHHLVVAAEHPDEVHPDEQGGQELADERRHLDDDRREHQPIDEVHRLLVHAQRCGVGDVDEEAGVVVADGDRFVLLEPGVVRLLHRQDADLPVREEAVVDLLLGIDHEMVDRGHPRIDHCLHQVGHLRSDPSQVVRQLAAGEGGLETGHLCAFSSL